jgi:poly(3-hydroxybutyrate) depolymerase
VTARAARGRVLRLEHSSDALRGNRLGDPHVRDLPVYLPPGYDEGTERYPVLFCLAGFTGTGESHLAWKGWGESLPERLDRLLDEGAIGPMIVALPDCFTRLGGSQYINSSTCGAYDDYLVRELVPLVDGRLRTKADRAHRGIFGKSSGGFGAIVQAMLHPDVWGAVACHSGDAYFEFCFLAELPRTCNLVHRAGGVGPFLDAFARKPKHSSAEVHAVMHLAMAACFDPQPSHPDGFELPVNLHTGRMLPARWARWLAWDPVRMIPGHLEALRSLRALFVDCGDRDQYHLHYGARQMHEELVRGRVAHRYEEFSDNHSSIGYRMDVSLPVLWKALR